MRIGAVGDNCIDVYKQTGEAFPGGNPVNVAVYCVRLGEEASYTGVVGNDEYGRLLKDALKAKRVDVSHVREVPGQTAITEVEVIDNDRVFGDYYEGVLEEFSLTDSDIDFLASHDIVVSGIWGKIEKSLGDIKSKGVPIAFDFADKLEHPLVEEIIPHVDYAFFSYDEGEDAFIQDYMKNMQAKGPQLIVVTMGEKGSLVYDGANFYRYGIVPCEVVDTMGAGDSYIAAFICGILQQKSIEACMEMGAKNSCITIQYKGAW
ncbi:fructoselysine 6-kinase [Neobacillus vireti]|uniref:Fructoselysine 6-kinase n=1 Tax=Neobacillus vireti LMG 21834 TaxID=1131730 RepID=A0AB94IJN6_9BACI|nr:fructoselysine 6-kinase [Neobacillus vireti]ETI67276.1 fructoselysine 6-kinase [Neobacillus vireti LMG 21834]KLT18054.1 fructoselysine kinase [Neobacillus vireti]